MSFFVCACVFFHVVFLPCFPVLSIRYGWTAIYSCLRKQYDAIVVGAVIHEIIYDYYMKQHHWHL